MLQSRRKCGLSPSYSSSKYRQPHDERSVCVVEHRVEDGYDGAHQDPVEAGHAAGEISQGMETQEKVCECGGHSSQHTSCSYLHIKQEQPC